MNNNYIGIGLTVLIIAIIALLVSVAMFLLSIIIEKLRKPAMYLMMGSGVLFLVSFGLCTA